MLNDIEDRFGLDSHIIYGDVAVAAVVCYDCATSDTTVWTQDSTASISFEDLFQILRNHNRNHHVK